jgi:site-specific DNA-methyltransferase (adenine-specific)
MNLVVTSPPYKDCDGYSDELISRVLKDGSLCFVNMGHLVEDKMRPFRVAQIVSDAGFKLHDTITWVKNHYTPLRGNNLNNLTEFIFMFVKGKCLDLDRLSIGIPYKDKSNVGRYSDKDLKCRGNAWFIRYETIQDKSQKLHKDRFPLELPELCIKLANLKPNSIVLDPFGGSGTTAVATQKLGFEYFYIDKDFKCATIALERLKNEHTVY